MEAKIMKTKWMMWVVIVTSLAGAVLVRAGDFDGSKPLILAVLQTVACEKGEQPQIGDAESVNLPQFFHIDFNKKLITGKSPEGEVRETKIDTMAHHDGKLILQGIQKGKPWAAVIDEETGKVVISGLDNGVGIVVFGACSIK
jgi:hypothetical protein